MDIADASRAFNVEVLTSPSTSPSVLSTLNLPASNTSAYATGVTGAISANTEVGVRVKRSNGSGGSTFNYINATIVLKQ